jgi:two-component system, cell cycle response regulator
MPDSHATRKSSDRGLLSVAQIQHVLRVEFDRAQRYDYPVTCMLIAVDQLGLVRDRLGYDVKEEVMDGVVDLLRNATRSSDFLGRTADDRLMAVVPHTGAEGALTMSRRLLEAARTRPFAHGKDFGPITLSIGVSVNVRSKAMYFDSLLESAESALSEAVVGGGDRCVERNALAPDA